MLPGQYRQRHPRLADYLDAFGPGGSKTPPSRAARLSSNGNYPVGLGGPASTAPVLWRPIPASPMGRWTCCRLRMRRSRPRRSFAKRGPTPSSTSWNRARRPDSSISAACARTHEGAATSRSSTSVGPVRAVACLFVLAAFKRQFFTRGIDPGLETVLPEREGEHYLTPMASAEVLPR